MRISKKQAELAEKQNPEVLGIKCLIGSNTSNHLQTVAVIISFRSSDSYDELFTKVQQKSEEGTKVVVYQCQSEVLSLIFEAFQTGKSENQQIIQLLSHIKQVDPDCVVFNWECSDGYDAQQFSEGNDLVFSFLRLIMDRGHMAMFSDFSLKVLIKQWSRKVLGPPPFVIIGETDRGYRLFFDKQQLKNCPSGQLQTVAEMCANNQCYINVLPDTIIFSIDPKVSNELFTVKVLSIAQNVDIFKILSNHSCKQFLKEQYGSVGHAILQFHSGGILLASMGHWIELMKVDASPQQFFKKIQSSIGLEESVRLKVKYDQLDECDKSSFIQKASIKFVQSQAPCRCMAKKQP